jgi:BirA family transcriptional regulator, biotin operon repressor / biotin---[acetyl-CoA-carboxylase] ligase
MMSSAAFIKILDTVDSTNNYAMAKVRAGMARHGLAFAAKEQTAGKGQRGKIWQSAPGQNIAMSLLLKADRLKVEQQFCLSMAVSLGVLEFLKKYLGEEIKIKWPNDLYWRDRKAGGILIETVFKGNNWKWAVVGIGININQLKFHRSLPNPVSLQQITGRQYDVIEMAGELYDAVMHQVEQMYTRSANSLLKEYTRHLYQLNQMVTLKKGSMVFKTTVQGVSVLGQLLTIDKMERQFDFGEVEWVE